MIITLCGSNRFEAEFKAWNKALSLAGHVVHSLSVYPSDEGNDAKRYTDEDKLMLDQVHKQKIFFSDAILVLNRFAYIGTSTMSEIEFARTHSKRRFALESWGKGYGITDAHRELYRASAICAGVPSSYASPIDTFAPYFDGATSSTELLGPAGPQRMRLLQIVHPGWPW